MAFAWIYRVQMRSYSDSPQFFQWLGEVAGRWTPIFLLAKRADPLWSLFGPFGVVRRSYVVIQKHSRGKDS